MILARPDVAGAQTVDFYVYSGRTRGQFGINVDGYCCFRGVSTGQLRVFTTASRFVIGRGTSREWRAMDRLREIYGFWRFLWTAWKDRKDPDR